MLQIPELVMQNNVDVFFFFFFSPMENRIGVYWLVLTTDLVLCVVWLVGQNQKSHIQNDSLNPHVCPHN